jgi:rhodanese-related sulfurtransferase
MYMNCVNIYVLQKMSTNYRPCADAQALLFELEGQMAAATLISLGDLAGRAAELTRERPIVTVCRAGGRSAQATIMLRQAGFERVANLAGGMLRWRAEGRVVENASM